MNPFRANDETHQLRRQLGSRRHPSSFVRFVPGEDASDEAPEIALGLSCPAERRPPGCGRLEYVAGGEGEAVRSSPQVAPPGGVRSGSPTRVPPGPPLGVFHPPVRGQRLPAASPPGPPWRRPCGAGTAQRGPSPRGAGLFGETSAFPSVTLPALAFSLAPAVTIPDCPPAPENAQWRPAPARLDRLGPYALVENARADARGQRGSSIPRSRNRAADGRTPGRRGA